MYMYILINTNIYIYIYIHMYILYIYIYIYVYTYHFWRQKTISFLSRSFNPWLSILENHQTMWAHRVMFIYFFNPSFRILQPINNQLTHHSESQIHWKSKMYCRLDPPFPSISLSFLSFFREDLQFPLANPRPRVGSEGCSAHLAGDAFGRSCVVARMQVGNICQQLSNISHPVLQVCIYINIYIYKYIYI